MAHKKLKKAEGTVHETAMKHMVDRLDENNIETVRSVLPDNLADTYAFCYWASDGCYYCRKPGGGWYRVKCSE